MDASDVVQELVRWQAVVLHTGETLAQFITWVVGWSGLWVALVLYWGLRR